MKKVIILISLVILPFCSKASGSITKLETPYTVNNIENYTVRSKILGRTYDFHIKTPKGYHKPENKNKIYPVIYINDAPSSFKVAIGVTHFPKMDKAILVGIGFARGESGRSSRIRDLTPEHAESWVKYVTGGAPEYLAFIEKELIPFVETSYRVDPQRRTLSGQSLAGSFGAWVLLTKPEVFSSYVLTSPSLWFKEWVIFDYEASYARKHKVLNANVYFATGEMEVPNRQGKGYNMSGDQERMVDLLKSRNYKGLTVKSEVVAGTDHQSTFPVGLSKGLRWLYQDVWALK